MGYTVMYVSHFQYFLFLKKNDCFLGVVDCFFQSLYFRGKLEDSRGDFKSDIFTLVIHARFLKDCSYSFVVCFGWAWDFYFRNISTPDCYCALKTEAWRNACI